MTTEPNVLLVCGKREWRGNAAVRRLWMLAFALLAFDIVLILLLLAMWLPR